MFCCINPVACPSRQIAGSISEAQDETNILARGKSFLFVEEVSVAVLNTWKDSSKRAYTKKKKYCHQSCLSGCDIRPTSVDRANPRANAHRRPSTGRTHILTSIGDSALYSDYQRCQQRHHIKRSRGFCPFAVAQMQQLATGFYRFTLNHDALEQRIKTAGCFTRSFEHLFVPTHRFIVPYIGYH